MSKYSVILLNMGGPDSLDAIEPFLFNLFSDRDIIKIPFGQKIFARILSKRRAPHVSNNYRQIGGKSPLNEWTEVQRSMLETALQELLPETQVYTAMRYWHPNIKTVAGNLSENNFDKIVLLPLYPHYSITTTGSAFNEWKRFYKGESARMKYVDAFFDNHIYISAINERIDEAMMRFPENVRDEIQILFSAHGTPERLVKSGDPYKEQIEATIKYVMEARDFSHDHHVCFQSKVGPLKWLEPSTHEMIEELAAKKKKQLLLVPVSFVSDHIETLFELDIEYRAIADKLGIENFIVMKGLNNSKTFIEALKEIVVDALDLGEVSNRNQIKNG
ncbi:MAG: ferrochelatase [Desulfobacteraceae bacterium]|nr:ferrochelatase [Desulfobacteraceae bacterium]MDH3574995.1 ferrochelatase [Desulfobacteraceae bacterium]MDH3720650.1 ferrochelatase [Desulfobacteraceae bacterium]MDH3836511.1 ferrochelatase [Desulfobacteraceae bacterium]MDH3876104.1 ferrochelatase [Desulfobacteraceae bacterium]